MWVVLTQSFLQCSNLEPSLSFPFLGAGGGGGGGGGGKEPGIHCLHMHQFFPEIWESGYHSDIFRYMIVIIDGRGCTTSIVMLHGSYSFTHAPLLLLFVSPSEEGTTHTAVKAVYDGKDVFVCLPNWI